MKTVHQVTKLILLAAVFLALPVFGQGVDKIAQTGMKWLSIPVGARASALGGAYTAVANDASAVFWNPAGLALSDGGHVFLSQTRWIADINANAGAASFNVENLGVFGVHVLAVDWGTLHGTRFSGGAELFEETGEFSPESWALGASFARRVSDKFSFGGNLKFVHENLGTTLEGAFSTPQQFKAEMNVVAIDFGTVFYTGFKDLRIAMLMQNVSQEKEYRFESFPLPLTFKFGAAMEVSQLFAGLAENHSVTFSADALHLRDFSERLHFGLEYGFKKMVFLRGGYKTNYDEEDLTLGSGVRLNLGSMALGLDYSYLAFENFDAVHMFSFDFGF
jgi:long-subunit fatty acid transport protein